MPDNITKWRVYCNTEQKWVENWVDTNITPDTCFTNSDHEIADNSFQVIDRIALNNFKIIEEEIPTGGFFRSQGFNFEIPANSLGTLDVSWKYPVGVLTSKIQTSADDIGNTIDGVVGPNTIIGILTADTEIGSTVLSVSSTVVNNAHVGLEILINGQMVGEVLSVNLTESTLLLTKPLEAVYSVGSLVGGQRRIIKNFNLGYTQGCDIGDSKIGASYVPADTITRVYYTNNTLELKKFNFNIEYLY